MIAFRPATRADVGPVVALLADDMLGRDREGGDIAPCPDAFDAMQAEGANHLIVGEDGGRIVACHQIVFISGLSLSGARRAEIEGVRVAADLRGRGMGAALMAEAETRARAAGCALIQLTTKAARTDAQRLSCPARVYRIPHRL